MSTSAVRRPNILILLADQHRAESMGYSGCADIRTPNFDRMARQGANFTHCVSTYPVCSPYRACLQTGLFGHHNGVVWNEEDIDTSLPNLAGCFSDAGYATAYFGKCHWHGAISANSIYTPPEFRLGWEHWVGWQNGHHDHDMPTFDGGGNQRHEYAGQFVPEVQTRLLMEWVEQQGDEPWIAQVNWGPPHNISPTAADPSTVERSRRIAEERGLEIAPHLFEERLAWGQSFPLSLIEPVAPDRFFEVYPAEGLRIPPNVPAGRETVVRLQLQQYYAQISALDDLTGRIMDWLMTTGRADDTIVIYTADHGDFVGSHRGYDESIRSKCTPHQCCARVPMLVWGPNHIHAGTTTQVPIGTIDLLPTVCGLAGVPIREAALPGTDLSGWATGGDGPILDDALLMLQAWRAIFDGRYMYAVGATADGVRPWLLFDTTDDMYDLRNLVNEPTCSPLVGRLHSRLIDRLEQAGDDQAYIAAMRRGHC